MDVLIGILVVLFCLLILGITIWYYGFYLKKHPERTNCNPLNCKGKCSSCKEKNSSFVEEYHKLHKNK